MAGKSIQEKAQQLEDEETKHEPGRTPGQAEGEDVSDEPYDPATDPGRTPGQAEGDRESVEGRGLDEETPIDRKPNSGNSSTLKSTKPAQEKKDQAKPPRKHPVTLLQQQGQRQTMEELMRWSALLGGGWLALYGLRHSLGSLMLIGIGGGLLYYALKGEWSAQQNKVQLQESMKNM
jgi:hypothetical protein